MEASQAGLAASGDGQGEAQDQGHDAIGQLGERLSAFEQSAQEAQEENRKILQNAPWMQQAEEEPQAPPPPDLSSFDENSPNYDPENAAQRLQEIMQEQGKSAAQQALEEQLGPMREELAELRSQRAADDLAAQFPELEKPEIAKQVIEKTGEYAQMIGDPSLEGNFDFIKLVYMASKAAQRQAEDTGRESPNAATLEAGGASPAGSQGQPSGEQLTDLVTQNWGQGNKLFR